MPPPLLPPIAGSQLSEAVAEAIASAVAGDPLLHTLEVRHPAFRDETGAPVSAWIVNDLRALTALDENGVSRTYQGLPFRYIPAEQSDSGAPRPAALEIDNVSLRVASFLMQARGSREPVQVAYRLYLPSDLSGPHNSPVPVLEAAEPVITLETIQIQLVVGGLTNKKFPARVYTLEDFPGLAP